MSTTNAEDQRKASELKSRLAEQSQNTDAVSSAASTATTGDQPEMDTVSIDDGSNKYVLIRASKSSSEPRHFVLSSRFAQYHRDAAEPMVAALERAGHKQIEILGGGRISLDTANKEIKIYGFSYGFGMADHATSKKVVEADSRYKDFSITISNDGY